jgi:hypothetical protein
VSDERTGGVIGLDPTSGPLPTSTKHATERPASLEDVTVGLISNGLGESDAFLRAVYCELERRYGAREAVFVRKPSVSVPPEPFDWERLISQVTVAVAGFGG